MNVPKANEDFQAYKDWRKSLQPLPVGTYIQWNYETLRGSTQLGDIKPKQIFMITDAKPSFVTKSKEPADLVYTMHLCSIHGKLFKRKEAYTVEGIARYIEEKKFVVVQLEPWRDTRKKLEV